MSKRRKGEGGKREKEKKGIYREKCKGTERATRN